MEKKRGEGEKGGEWKGNREENEFIVGIVGITLEFRTTAIPIPLQRSQGYIQNLRSIRFKINNK